MSTDSRSAGQTTAGAVPTSQLLTFALGDEVFAMDIRTVREIIQYGSISTLPLMPDFIRGVINLRGAVLPVIDLQARFSRPPAKVMKKTCIVIFDALREGERVELGLLVDSVSAVIDMAADRIEPPPDFGTGVKRDFIRGIAKLSDRFVIVLDADRALNVDEMAQLCDAAEPA